MTFDEEINSVQINGRLIFLGENQTAEHPYMVSELKWDNVDLQPISELVRLTRNISNNINQVTRRANECGCVYEDEVIDLLAEVNRLKPLLAEAHREAIRLRKH